MTDMKGVSGNYEPFLVLAHTLNAIDESKAAIASALYRTISPIAFSISMPFMSVVLRCTVSVHQSSTYYDLIDLIPLL